MATDLATVQDHPAEVIIQHSMLEHPDDRYIMERAAKILRQYEVVNGVTFAALDNVTLIRIADAYDEGRDSDLSIETNALLGLE